MNAATDTRLITPSMTARAMGSGSLDVLATPALIAFMEHVATMAVNDLLTGQCLLLSLCRQAECLELT